MCVNFHMEMQFFPVFRKQLFDTPLPILGVFDTTQSIEVRENLFSDLYVFQILSTPLYPKIVISLEPKMILTGNMTQRLSKISEI